MLTAAVKGQRCLISFGMFAKRTQTVALLLMFQYFVCNDKRHFVFIFFVKLLKSPGKDCPKFRALMTETFESVPYQTFLRANQVRYFSASIKQSTVALNSIRINFELVVCVKR